MKPLAFFLACCVACLVHGREPQPVLHWNFNEPKTGTPLLDLRKALPARWSGGQNVGWQPSRMGHAIDLGRELTASGVPCPCLTVAGMPVDFTKPFTVVTVLKLYPEAATDKGYRAFKDVWGNTATRGPGVRLSVFYGMLCLNAGDGTTPSSISSRAARTPIPIDRWFQVACTYDGRQAAIYLNGQQVASGPLTILPPSHPFSIGAFNGKAYPLPGLVDDIAIYQAALTQKQIVNLYMDFVE